MRGLWISAAFTALLMVARYADTKIGIGISTISRVSIGRHHTRLTTLRLVVGLELIFSIYVTKEALTSDHLRTGPATYRRFGELQPPSSTSTAYMIQLSLDRVNLILLIRQQIY